MSISTDQKLDYLWKKVGYGAAKRDINSVLNATQEGVPSPLLLRGDNVWAKSGDIPGTHACNFWWCCRGISNH